MKNYNVQLHKITHKNFLHAVLKPYHGKKCAQESALLKLNSLNNTWACAILPRDRGGKRPVVVWRVWRGTEG